MQSIILAAGTGSRLKPLTDNLPKCMVKLNGHALIHHQIRVLQKSEINNIHIAGGYLAHKIAAQGATLSINHKYAQTNMAYTLFDALHQFDQINSDLVISYGDIVFTEDVLASILQESSQVSVTVDLNWRSYWEKRMDNPLLDAETLIVDQFNNIKEIGKKPTTYNNVMGQYIGLIKVKKESLNPLKEEWKNLADSHQSETHTFENMYMTSFLQHLIDNSWEVKASYIRGGWAEIDCPRDLLVAESMQEFH